MKLLNVFKACIVTASGSILLLLLATLLSGCQTPGPLVDVCGGSSNPPGIACIDKKQRPYFLEPTDPRVNDLICHPSADYEALIEFYSKKQK